MMCVRRHVNPWENTRSFGVLAARPNGFSPRKKDLVDGAKLEEVELLTFTSGDEAAKTSVSALETMGIADRWQRVGKVKVRLQNSGSIGAETNISIKLAEGQSLNTAARSLAALGIELG
ncbi:MAG: hypothetical protein KAI47_13455 [Deltaproteobacteria bacterium]|nr:hypothetical protein [Deltaproteobacteria bacterium]